MERFAKSTLNKSGRANKCKICVNAIKAYRRRYDKEYAKYLTRKSRISEVKRRYGIPYEEYEKCMASSDCCEICGSKEKLVYDHCHTSMDFRGVLCRTCNLALGNFKDSIENLERAIIYLKRSENE